MRLRVLVLVLVQVLQVGVVHRVRRARPLQATAHAFSPVARGVNGT